MMIKCIYLERKIQNKVNNSYVIIFANYPYYLLRDLYQARIRKKNSRLKYKIFNIR